MKKSSTSAASDYSYDLPPELIAAAPAEPRDSARLFAYDRATGKIAFDIFADLSGHLPSPALLVINDTKVIPARAILRKESKNPRLQRGKVEALFLLNEWKGGDEPFDALLDRKASVGDRLSFDDAAFSFRVVAQTGSRFSLEPLFEAQRIFGLLEKYGRTPVPKYIKGVALSEADLRERYQSVFAENPSSVAAPTASLHFTERVFEQLKARGIETARITLHVGLGTFAPITEKNEKEGKLHRERFSISAESHRAIYEAKKAGIPVIAVGTTVVRALESAAGGLLQEENGAIAGETDIFIRPPFDFKIVDAIITNFHLPDSSLMMLVQAFLEQKNARNGDEKHPARLRDLYQLAIAEHFRFYSFGDAMLLR